jgi:hypothetical protein
MKPILHTGNTLLLNTLICPSLNADFDGDCVICDIKYLKNNEEKKCKIEDLLDNEKFVFKNNKIKENGSIIEKYKPIDDLYILAISTETSDISYKKITEFSIHYNLDMFKVKDPKERFKEFFVSSDHSLIIYDEIDDKIKKISPTEVLKNPNGKFLIKNIAR